MSPKRKFVDSPFRLTIAQIIGVSIVFTGIIVLVWIGVYSFNTGKTDGAASSMMAIGFFLLMIGFAFFYPDMLKSAAKDSVSTMRVIVYMIVCVFVFLSVKIGWSVSSLNDFAIDKTWAYILGIALGSKAVQSLGENNWLGASRKTPPLPKKNTMFPKSNTSLPENFSRLKPSTLSEPLAPPDAVLESKSV